MVKVEKYNVFFKLFVIFLTIFLQFSCSNKNYQLSNIEAKQLPINNPGPTVSSIETFIQPYREHINKDLDNVLSFAPETLNKNVGKWQSPLGSLLADMTLELGNPVFNKREQKSIDICLLNQGGIRAIIPQGNVTTRTAFEVMPFENKLVVVGLQGAQILEMLSYFIKEKQPHPLSGITFTISKDQKPVHIYIQNKAFDITKTYYVATNDYLSNGGDSMNFFLTNTGKFDLEYKMRNILIDYLKRKPTLIAPTDLRVTEEK